ASSLAAMSLGVSSAIGAGLPGRGRLAGDPAGAAQPCERVAIGSVGAGPRAGVDLLHALPGELQVTARRSDDRLALSDGQVNAQLQAFVSTVERSRDGHVLTLRCAPASSRVNADSHSGSSSRASARIVSKAAGVARPVGRRYSTRCTGSAMVEARG